MQGLPVSIPLNPEKVLEVWKLTYTCYAYIQKEVFSLKKTICTLLALALICLSAMAETSIIEKPAIIIEMITPSPSPEPAGETFSIEDLIVTLPAGMTILTADERAGYDAAASFDYPLAGSAVLLAVNAEEGSAVVFSISESTQDAASAANEAARSIPEAGTVEEITLGENTYSAFSCTMDGADYRLYFLSDGSRLLCAGACGLEETEIDAMLAGLIF